MTTEELEKALGTMTKQDIIDTIMILVEENILSLDNFADLTIQNKMTEYEEKILKEIVYTNDELEYIKEKISKVSNRKVHAVIKGQDKFVSTLVERKLEKYFSYCWKSYPRKVGKQLGQKAFVKLFDNAKVSEIDNVASYVLGKVKAYAQQCEDNDTEEKYIMHFSTFCNSKKYL